MPITADPTWWPLQGLRFLINRPSLILRALLASLLVLLVVLGASGLVLWWRWPAGDLGWLGWLLACGAACGWAGLTALGLWLLASPLLASLALESITRAALRQAGQVPCELPLARSLAASCRVLLNGLPSRLGWSGAAAGGCFLGPVGLALALWSSSRAMVLDCTDTALGLCGLGGAQRIALLARLGPELRGATAVAGLLQFGLGVTFLGWLLWPAALACGAGLRAGAWLGQAEGGLRAGSPGVPSS